MNITLINHSINNRTKQLNFKGSKDVLAKEFQEVICRSKTAMQELAGENFNSETLRMLLSPAYKSKHPNCVMAISKSKPYHPVEVAYKISEVDSEVMMDIFPKDSPNVVLGQKIYYLGIDDKGKMIMKSGFMSSDDELCKQAGVRGIGTLERILQVKEAIKNGITRIPCYSYARATLYHLKMGFTPVPDLKRIYSMYSIKKILEDLIHRPGSDVFPENYTPIVVTKGIFNKEYYLDVSATQCLATMRQIKQDLAKGLCDEANRPVTHGQGVQLVLEGKNFNIWKQMFGKV